MTARQRFIIGMLARDWTDRRIAGGLGISDRQVRRDINSLCRQFGATGRIQLVGKAVLSGAVPATVFVS